MKNFLHSLFNILLFLTAILGCVGIYFANDAFEVPDFIVQKILHEVPMGNFRVKFGSIKYQLGGFVVRDVVVEDKNSREKILTADFAKMRIYLSDCLSGRAFPRMVFVDSLAVHCPATISRTGKSETLVEDGRIFAYVAGGKVKIGTISARLGNSLWALNGELKSPLKLLNHFTGTPMQISVPASVANVEPSVPASSVPASVEKSFSLQALVPYLQFLQRVKVAQTQTGLDGRYDVGVNLRSRIDEESRAVFDVGLHLILEATDNLQLNRFFDLLGDNAPKFGDFSANKINLTYDFSASFDVGNWQPKLSSNEFLALTCGNVNLNTSKSLLDNWQLNLKSFSAGTRLNLDAGTLNDVFSNATIFDVDSVNASNFLYGDFVFEQVGAVISGPQKWGASIDLFAYDSGLRLWANFIDETFEVHYSLLPQFAVLRELPVISAYVPADLKTLKFSSRPRVAGTVNFDNAKQFESIDFDFNAPATTWQTLNARSIRACGKITPSALTIYHAEVCGNDFCTSANVSVALDGSGLYRTHIGGTFYNVELLDPYLDWFWWRIWRDVKLTAGVPAPRIDLEIYGSFATEPIWERIFGFIAGDGASRNGCPVDKISLRVVEEAPFVAVPNLIITKNNHRVAGTLLFNYVTKPEPHMSDFQFRFAGTMPVDDVLELTGEGVPEIFRDLQFASSALGTADVIGNFSGDERFEKDLMAVDVDVKKLDGDYKIFGFEGSQFSGKINYKNTSVALNELKTKFGNGDVAGTIVLNFPNKNMSFAGTQVAVKNLSIDNVKLNKLVELADSFLASLPDAPEKKAEFFQKSDDGSAIEKSNVVANFAGTLTLPKIETLSGNGHFKLHDETLFKYEFLGRTSQLLSMLYIPFFSFDITNAESDLTIKNGIVNLPQLEMTSENALIEGELTCDLATLKLAGDFVFKNRRGTEIPVLGHVVRGLSNWTALTPLSVTGTLYDMEIHLAPLSSEKSIFNFDRKK